MAPKLRGISGWYILSTLLWGAFNLLIGIRTIPRLHQNYPQSIGASTVFAIVVILVMYLFGQSIITTHFYKQNK